MFRPILIALALAIFLPFCDVKAGDPIPATVKQSINKCLIGECDIVMTLGEEKSTGSYTATWMPGQTAVRLEAIHNGPSGVEYTNSVLGWHADSKALIVHGFESQGYWTIKYTEIRPTEWIGGWEGYLNGEMQESKSVFKATDTGWEYRDTTNGMDLVYKATRKVVVDSQQPRVVGDPLDDFNRYLLAGGSWKLQGEDSVAHRYTEGAGTRYLIRYGAPNSISVVGRHPKTNVMTWWLFRDTGEVFVTKVSGERKSECMFKLNYAAANGEQGEISAEILSENRLIASQSGKIVGKSATGDHVWEVEETPSDIKWLAADAGSKELADKLLLRGTTGFRSVRGVSEDGQKFYGTTRGRWILGGKFFLYIGNGLGEGGEQIGHVVICGVDPETDKVTGWEFDSFGAHNTLTLNETGDEITGAGYKGNGERFEFNGTLTEIGEILQYHATQSIDGGERLPYEWSYHPVPAKGDAADGN